jgi:hypothetical protein
MFNYPFYLENVAVYEIMLKHIVEQSSVQMAMWRMLDTNTHSEFVIIFILHCNKLCTNAPQRSVYSDIVLFVC